MSACLSPCVFLYLSVCVCVCVCIHACMHASVSSVYMSLHTREVCLIEKPSSKCLNVCGLCLSQMFTSSVHTCEVCLSEKPGSKCLSLEGCRHVFCCECLRANCELNITEGSVANLMCMMPDCTSQLHPTQVYRYQCCCL